MNKKQWGKILCIIFVLYSVALATGCHRKTEVYSNIPESLDVQEDTEETFSSTSESDDQIGTETGTEEDEKNMEERAIKEETEAFENRPVIDTSSEEFINYFVKKEYRKIVDEKYRMVKLVSENQFVTIEIAQDEKQLSSISVSVDVKSMEEIFSSEVKTERTLHAFQDIFECIGVSYDENMVTDFIKNKVNGETEYFDNKINMYAQYYDEKYLVIISGVSQ